MKYLEKTFEFLGKYYILLVPLYIMVAVPAIINGINSVGAYAALFSMLGNIPKNPGAYQDIGMFWNLLSGFMGAAVGASLLAFALTVIITPAAYGMVNRALMTGSADLNDFVPSFKENIVKYLLFWVGTIVIWLLFAIIAIVLFLLLALVASIVKIIGAILLVLAVLAFVAVAVILMVMISLWFPAMVVDNLDVMDALKKSIQIAKQNFWIILGVTLLVSIAGAIAGGILGFFALIPIVGSLISSVVPAITSFIMIAFSMILYREKAGAAW